jgi:hypothetical protein
MSSDDDGAELMAAFKSRGARKAAPPKIAEQPAQSPEASASGHNSEGESGRSLSNTSRTRRALCVRVEPIDDKEEYVYYEPKDEVEGILREFSKRKGGDLLYEVRLFGDKTKQVSDSGKGSDNAQ